MVLPKELTYVHYNVGLQNLPTPHSVPPLGGGWKTSHPTDLRGVLIRKFILGVCFRDILVHLQNPPPLVNKRSYALAFCYPWGCILYCIQSNWVNVNKMIRGKLPNTHLKLFINRPCVKNNGWEFCSFIGISFFLNWCYVAFSLIHAQSVT